MAKLELPVPVYNWLVDFFREHAHRTVFNREESSTASISASIVQGSGIGPEAYTVTAADLKPLQPGSLTGHIRRRHASCRSFSQRQHRPAGDGQHCNIGCSE